MSDIASLATKIEAAKIAGNGITLSHDELTGFLSIAALLGGAPVSAGPSHRVEFQVGRSSAGEADPDECITINEVCRKLKISRQTLYRHRRDGSFTPQPINSAGTKWLRSDFVRWLRERQS